MGGFKLRFNPQRKIAIDLAGGIGNQFFRYFAGLVVAEKLNAPLRVYFTELDRSHSQFNSRITDLSTDLQVEYKTPIKGLRSFFVRVVSFLTYKFRVVEYCRDKVMGIYKESGQDLQHEIEAIERLYRRFPYPRTIHLRGHFQDLNYFHYAKEVRLPQVKAFSEIVPLEPLKVSKVLDIDKKICLVHVRRGDFKNHKSDIGLLDSEYYRRAMSLFVRKHANSHFLVISDDIAECKKLLPIEFQSISTFSEESQLMNPAELLQKSIAFKSFILSNSTYSLWIALLAKDPSTVIYPSPYNLDLDVSVRSFPQDWIAVQSSFLS
jgi:hypothetical protein